MNNRGYVSTTTILQKLQAAQSEISNNTEHRSPILFVNGRLNKKNYEYVAKNFSLLKSLEKDIKKYCRGVDLTVLNYLIFRGIESIKKENIFLDINYSDIENIYNK